MFQKSFNLRGLFALTSFVATASFVAIAYHEKVPWDTYIEWNNGWRPVEFTPLEEWGESYFVGSAVTSVLAGLCYHIYRQMRRHTDAHPIVKSDMKSGTRMSEVD